MKKAMLNLKIIQVSTREGRKGPAVSKWIYELAKKHMEFDVELIDLAEVNLPMLDEPNHPRFKNYTKQHTKDWSARIEPADAFIIVTAEYNFGFPAVIKNALDYLYQEWNDKAVAFVSYGGVAAGTRAVQMLKQVVTALKMMPVVESVNIPFFMKHIDEQGNFNAEEGLVQAAEGMLRELARWAEALKEMRGKK
jgi:NAD(P)H-dependent FMN reductase